MTAMWNTTTEQRLALADREQIAELEQHEREQVEPAGYSVKTPAENSRAMMAHHRKER